MTYILRTEQPQDFPAIRELVRTAFAGAEFADGDEHFLVDRLRDSPEYIPELSLVAEIKGVIVGHIMFTKLTVGEGTALALAPLSVLPAQQGRGIGTALIRRGHSLAVSAGWEWSIVLGHPDYYPRFGYKPASGFGITSPFAVPDAAFMALPLKEDAKPLAGVVHYTPAFFPETK